MGELKEEKQSKKSSDSIFTSFFGVRNRTMVLLATFRRGLSLQGSKKMPIFNSNRTMATKPGWNGNRLPDFLNPDVNGNMLGPGLWSCFVICFVTLAGPAYWEFVRPKYHDDLY